MNCLKYYQIVAIMLLVMNACSSCKLDLTKPAEAAATKIKEGMIEGIPKLDPIRIDAAKRDAVELDRLNRQKDSIVFQAMESVGTFKIEGWLHSKTTVEKLWQIRISDVLDTGEHPIKPSPPDSTKLKGFAYSIAKQTYDAKMAAYKQATAKWETQFNRKLIDTGVDISPKLNEPGLYVFRLVITPEAETNGNWKVRIAARLQSFDKIVRQFKVIALEKRDFPNQPLEKPLPEDLSYFYAK